MTVAELLRQLADKLDSIEKNALSGDDVEDPEQEEQLPMMTPNQQKLELLKKSVGVDSEFDDEEYDSDCDSELHSMKKNAGINTLAAMHIASDDEPLE